MKKYLTIIMIFILILTMSPIIVKAAKEDITVTLSSETKTIKAGDTVNVVFTVSDSKKINGLEASLKSTEVLKVESVKIDQKENIFNNWSTSNEKLEISGNKASETLKVVIGLKVQSTPKDKVTFTVSGIEVNEDNTNWTESSINVGSKTIEFSPVQEQTKPAENGNNNQGNTTPETNNNQGNNNSGTNKPDTSNQGSNNSGTNKPDTSNQGSNNSGNNSGSGTNAGTGTKQRTVDPAIQAGSDNSAGKTTTTTTSKASTTKSSSGATETKTTTKTTPSTIPQTGENDVIFVVMGLVALVGVVAFVKYKQYQRI